VWVIVVIAIIVIAGGIYFYSQPKQSAVVPAQSDIVSVTIDQSSLTTTSSFPTITGTATNTPSVSVDIDGYLPAKGDTVALYTGKAPVISGNWSFTPSESGAAFGGPQGLDKGTYIIFVGQNESMSLATGTLTVK